jgi:hypothetical protein
VRGETLMGRIIRHNLYVAALLGLAACGGGGAAEKAAYDGCLASGKKPGSKVAAAQFGAQDKATFGFMQDSSINVRIPYTLNGQPGVWECSMVKQSDGTYKNQFDT